MNLDLKLRNYLHYYLYHLPRLKLDRKYRAKWDRLETLIRRVAS